MDKNNVEAIMGANLFTASAGILVAVGGIVAFISFLGCCGAIKGVKCLLALFFVIMFVLSIVIALAAIFAFIMKDKVGVEDDLANLLKQTMKKYRFNSSEAEDSLPITQAWDGIQFEFQCCGAKGYEDWVELNLTITEGPSFPSSCCKSNYTKCNEELVPEQDTFYSQGCFEMIKSFVEKHTRPLIIIGFVIAVVMVMAMVFSCGLCLML